MVLRAGIALDSFAAWAVLRPRRRLSLSGLVLLLRPLHGPGRLGAPCLPHAWAGWWGAFAGGRGYSCPSLPARLGSAMLAVALNEACF